MSTHVPVLHTVQVTSIFYTKQLLVIGLGLYWKNTQQRSLLDQNNTGEQNTQGVRVFILGDKEGREASLDEDSRCLGIFLEIDMHRAIDTGLGYQDTR